MTEVNITNNWGDINNGQNSRANPSHLALVVSELAKMPFQEHDEFKENNISFDIEEKIHYNDLGEYEFMIHQYCSFVGTLDEIYNAADEVLPSTKYMIRRRINQEYRRIKGGLLKANKNTGETPIETIRENSDRIIEKVLKYLSNLITNAGNLDKQVSEEGIMCALEIIIVDAFIECKILENPNGNNI